MALGFDYFSICGIYTLNDPKFSFKLISKATLASVKLISLLVVILGWQTVSSDEQSCIQFNCMLIDL